MDDDPYLFVHPNYAIEEIDFSKAKKLGRTKK